MNYDLERIVNSALSKEATMGQYETKDIRNVAFVGHGASGKTSLVEGILFKGRGYKAFR